MKPHTIAEEEAAARTHADQRDFEREEVAAHYEHDPDIFKMVLDSQLAYSTGICLDPSEDLETVQQRKFAHIRNLLQLQPGEKVFDAGCGWGSVMLNLAEHTGSFVHGVTLSNMQREVALKRAADRGIADRVRIDLQHVEEVELEPESVDVVTFIGSIVHMHNRERIHQWVGRILKPGGRLFISDCYFPVEKRGDRHSSATDYILADTLGYCRLINLADELAMIEAAGLDIRSIEDLTSSYVHTVGHWIKNIRKNRAAIEEMAPGFAHRLQAYMMVGQASFARRTSLEYMILASKGRGNTDLVDWTIPGRS